MAKTDADPELPAEPAPTAPEPEPPAAVERPDVAAGEAAAPDAQAPEPESSPTVLRYIGDGSVFQSNVPNRDVTVADDLSDELAELAIATGTHERVD